MGLVLQYRDGDRRAPFFRVGFGHPDHQRVGTKKAGDGPPELAGAVPVDEAHHAVFGHHCLVKVFLSSGECLFHPAADQVEFLE